MDPTLLAAASLDSGMLGIGDALKQAVQEAFFWLARTFWVSFLALELYVLKPLVLQTPVPTEFTFFSGHEDHIYYDPQISGPDGLIDQFYEKTSALAGFAMTLGLVFSGFMLGMGIASDNWLATAKENLRRLVFMAPFIYLSIYMLQFVAELSAMMTSFFLDEETYDEFLLELPQLIINPGTPKFSDEVGLIIGLAMTSIVLFLVLLELVARFAVMVFIPAISPLLFCLLIFNWSRPMAQSALKLYMTAAFFQPALAICLNFTLTLVLAMRSNSTGTVAPWAMLAGCAALMAYLPKVLSGTGNQLSQAASGIKTAAIATVATVAVSTGAGAVAVGKLGAAGAAGVAGSRGGFGSVSSAISRGGNWAAKAGWRQSERGLAQMANLAKEGTGMGGLTRLPHDDFGYTPRSAASFPGKVAAGLDPAVKPDGKASPAVAGQGLDRLDRAAFNLGDSHRRRREGHDKAPASGAILAGSARDLTDLEGRLATAPQASPGLQSAVQRARANPKLAAHLDRLLGAPDASALAVARTAAARDTELQPKDQEAYAAVAAEIYRGRGLAPQPVPGWSPPSPTAGRPFAGHLGRDAGQLLADAEAAQAKDGGAIQPTTVAQAHQLGRRAVFGTAASTGSSVLAADLAQVGVPDSPAVDAHVKDAAKQLQSLANSVLAVQQAAHSTMKGASVRFIQSRQPNAIRDSVVALGQGSRLAESEPFLRQVEAGKYDGQANGNLTTYLRKNRDIARRHNITVRRADHLTPQQAGGLLESIPKTDELRFVRAVLTQIASGDQDNASLRAYQRLQADLARGAPPATPDVRVVTSFNKRQDEALLTHAGPTRREPVEQALAAIRAEVAAGAERLSEEEARLAAEQAIRVAAHVDRSSRAETLK